MAGSKPRLLKWQYDELNAQYANTPPLMDGVAASGEHYVLFNLLNRFGFRPNSREEAMELTEELLTEGRRYFSAGAMNNVPEWLHTGALVEFAFCVGEVLDVAVSPERIMVLVKSPKGIWRNHPAEWLEYKPEAIKPATPPSACGA